MTQESERACNKDIDEKRKKTQKNTTQKNATRKNTPQKIYKNIYSTKIENKDLFSFVSIYLCLQVGVLFR